MDDLVERFVAVFRELKRRDPELARRELAIAEAALLPKRPRSSEDKSS